MNNNYYNHFSLIQLVSHSQQQQPDLQFSWMLPGENGKHQACQLTQLFWQLSAPLCSHHSLILHVTLVTHQEHLSIVPRVRFDLGWPVGRHGTEPISFMGPMGKCDFLFLQVLVSQKALGCNGNRGGTEPHMVKKKGNITHATRQVSNKSGLTQSPKAIRH